MRINLTSVYVDDQRAALAFYVDTHQGDTSVSPSAPAGAASARPHPHDLSGRGGAALVACIGPCTRALDTG